MNLFVGVIFKEFEDAQEEERASLMLKENQVKWVDMMKMIVEATPDIETVSRPKEGWRKYVHSLVTGSEWKHNYFDYFIMTCIVLNMLHMAVNFDDSPQTYNLVLEKINYFFTAVFLAECMLKLIAFGGAYFKKGWNVFDFCVVLSSIFEIVLDLMDTASIKFLRLGPQLAKVLRLTRVSRILRLMSRYKGL